MSWASKPGPPGKDGKDGERGPVGRTGPQGPPGRDGQVTDEHIARIVVAVVEQLRNDPSLRGKDGEPGRDGRDGKDAELNYDLIISEVIKRLPPIEVEQLDASGKVIGTGEAYLGGKLRLFHASGVPQS